MAKGSKTKIFSEKTFQRTKVISANQNILNAPESLPNLRKEIARVFHQANRRIQNIESKGYLSPALKGLNITETGFSKFAMSGKTWLELRIEYAKAIEFLKKPTSTAQGAKEYETHIKSAMQLSDEDFNRIKKAMNGETFSTDRERKFTENYLMRYKDFSGDFEREAQSLADQIENESYKLNNTEGLINPLQTDLENLFDGVDNIQDMENIISNLKGFEI